MEKKWFVTGGRILLVILFLFFIKMPVAAEGGLNVQAEISGQGVLLKWENSDPTVGYQIQRSDRAEGDFTLIATISGQTGTVSCYDYGVSLGQTYYYKVQRIETGWVAEESPVITVSVTLTAPSDVSGKRTKDEKANLTWSEVQGADGYEIYRSTNPDKTFKLLGTVEKPVYIDNSVKAGKAYYYRIKAIQKEQKALTSPFSEMTAVYMKPAAPKVSGSYTKKKIKLTWKKVAGAERYDIYKKNSQGVYKKVGESDKLYFTDKKVKKGRSYEYQVVALYERDGYTVKSKASATCKQMADSIDPGKKMVALTFDDGPGRYTKEIVDCLKKNDARATFFVLGCNVDSYKSAMQAADKIGCEIASHTYHHYNLANLSKDKIKWEVSETDKKIKNAIGKTPELVRTPGGSFNSTVKETVGKPIILWSIDTLDWKTRSRDKTVNAVMNHVKDGDIVLMHDIHQPSKEAALILIPRLKRQGYQLVTVSELAQYRGYTMKKGNIYYSFRKR